MFGFRVIRQYEHGIVFRWGRGRGRGRGRVEVERGRGQRHHVEAEVDDGARIPSVSGGEFPGKQRPISFPLQFEPLTDKKTTS
jgi:hypothetical protein